MKANLRIHLKLLFHSDGSIYAKTNFYFESNYLNAVHLVESVLQKVVVEVLV